MWEPELVLLVTPEQRWGMPFLREQFIYIAESLGLLCCVILAYTVRTWPKYVDYIVGVTKMGYEDYIQNIKTFATVEIAKTNIDFGKRLILLLTKIDQKYIQKHY